jgi:hypothetical protein
VYGIANDRLPVEAKRLDEDRAPFEPLLPDTRNQPSVEPETSKPQFVQVVWFEEGEHDAVYSVFRHAYLHVPPSHDGV